MTAPTIIITGSGTLGHVADWSATEEATPHSLADRGGSVGSLSISAQAVTNSVYLNDCDVSLLDVSDYWTGRILDARLQGPKVEVTAESALRFLAAVRTAPPVGTFVQPVTAVGGQGSGNGEFLYPGDVAFDSSGNMFVADRGNLRIQKFTPDGNGGWTYSAQVGSSGTGNGQFGGTAGTSSPNVGWLAVDSSNNVYATDPFNQRVQKFTNNLVYSAQVGASGAGNGQFTTAATGIAIDSSNNVYVRDYGNPRIQKFNSSLVYQSQFSLPASGNGMAWDAVTGALFISVFYDGTPTSYNNVRQYSTAGTYASLATPGGLGVADGYFGAFPTSPAATQNPQDVAVLSDGTVVVSDVFNNRVQFFNGSLTYLGKFGSYGSNPGEFADPRGLGVDADDNIYVADHGNHRIQVFSRAALTNTVPLSEAIESYIRLCDPDAVRPFSYDAATDPEVAFPGWTDNVWTKLKELCAVYNLEIYYQADTIHVGDIGSRELDITNRTAPQFNAGSIMPAQSVAVVNQNTVAGSGLTMYDASLTKTIHTINVAQTTTVTLTTTNHPTYLNQPTPVDAAPIAPGQYAVQDSGGVAITAVEWVANGGSVRAEVGSATGTIVLTITGPPSLIPGYTAPYSLGSGTGVDRVATLIVTGAGVTTNPQVVTVPTGADDSRITREVGVTLDSPFVGSPEQAYDAGVWAASTFLFDATLTFTIPRETGAAFGDYAGCKFTYQNARWRVMAAKITPIGVEITARWHTTVGEVDTLWTGYVIRDVNLTPSKVS